MDITQQISENLKALTGHMASMAESMKGFDDRLKAEAAERQKIQERVDALAAQSKKRAHREVSVPGTEEKNDKREFSFFRAAQGIVYGDWRGAEYEREVFMLSDEQAYGVSRGERDFAVSHRADMTTSNDQLGGYLVPTQVLTQFFIEQLRPNVVVEKLGATVMDNLVGSPVEIPRQIRGATAFWTGENQAITPSDLNVGQINLQPRMIAALVKMSRRLQRMSIPSAEQLVRQDMGLAIAEAMDLAALRGSGASGEPVGVANTIGINTVALGTNGGTFDFTAADLMRQALSVDNALRGKLGYAMNPTVSGVMRRERIAQFTGQLAGAYVMLPFSDAEMRDRLGYSFEETTQIPTNLSKGTGVNLSEVYFANWAELILGIWATLELDASREAGDAFQKHQVWLKATVESDLALRHVESFCLVSDAKTT